MNIALIDLCYPYGKKKIYMNGSLIAIAARLMAMQHSVDIIDLNIDDVNDSRIVTLLSKADWIGFSLIGAPYIPSAMALATKLRQQFPQTPIAMGGQVIEKMEQQQFQIVFSLSEVFQAKDDTDLAKLLGCSINKLPAWNEVPFWPVWEHMGLERFRVYLEREGTLVVSQGCNKNCDFCAAAKAERETFRSLELFVSDLLYLSKSAKSLGLSGLQFYASSLDFFQNLDTVKLYLEALAEVRKSSGLDIRVRCLSCPSSFVEACEKLPDLDDLLNRSGLERIGFGSDGADEEVWCKQNKKHNHIYQVVQSIEFCRDMGVASEVLMVIGFEEDTSKTLLEAFVWSLSFMFASPLSTIRPYLAKPFVPGNKGWKNDSRVAEVLDDPNSFFQLDFATTASKLTHPKRSHRWICNFAYLSLILFFQCLGRCPNWPLFAQGGRGPGAWLARLINRYMPPDR